MPLPNLPFNPAFCFIDGQWQPSSTAQTLALINPSNGQALSAIADGRAEDIDLAVVAAQRAARGEWGRSSALERGRLLLRLGALILEHVELLAHIEALDVGKPLKQARADAVAMARYMEFYGGAADKIHGETLPYLEGYTVYTLREAHGVTGHIVPWNYPMQIIGRSVGAALAMGNCCVLKPAEEACLSALMFAELARQAGLPSGVLNVVPGMGTDVGEPRGRHMDIDMISFTGSTETGKRFLRYAADSNAKEVVLEMGGKNPAVVMEDAENLDRVAQHIVNGAFWNMGENCSATSRLIVHKAVRDDLLARITNHMRHWPLGDPLDPETRLGALVSDGHAAKVTSGLEQADTVLVGGKAEGNFVDATVVDLSGNDHPLAQTEIFGPVLGVITVASFDEAISVANDTPYGLCASLFTANAKRALRGARMLKAGTVTENSYGEGDISTPFGGWKQSGFGGRDNGVHAHDQYTQLKTIWLDLSDDADEAVE